MQPDYVRAHRAGECAWGKGVSRRGLGGVSHVPTLFKILDAPPRIEALQRLQRGVVDCLARALCEEARLVQGGQVEGTGHLRGSLLGRGIRGFLVLVMIIIKDTNEKVK